MAKLVWTGDTGYHLALIEFGYLGVATDYARSSSKYVVKYPLKYSDTFTGSNFKYSGNVLKSGTIKTFVGIDEGDKTFTLSGLKLSASDVIKAAKTATISDDQTVLKKALSGDDSFFGGKRVDIIEGFGGNDKIFGGKGADILKGGGGADTFDYNSTKDSGTSLTTADIILDFKSNDRIDLSSIDANTSGRKNSVFKFIGQKDFTNDAAQLRYTKFSSETVIEGDVNGDGKADFSILLDDRVTMKKEYFIL